MAVDANSLNNWLPANITQAVGIGYLPYIEVKTSN